MNGFIVVSEEKFFSHINPLNIHPRSEPNCSIWETPQRKVEGLSYPGYLEDGEKYYMLPCEKEAG